MTETSTTLHAQYTSLVSLKVKHADSHVTLYVPDQPWKRAYAAILNTPLVVGYVPGQFCGSTDLLSSTTSNNQQPRCNGIVGKSRRFRGVLVAFQLLRSYLAAS